MNKAKLYVFSISHYCEKAKWALDLCGIDYELKVLIPSTYAKTTLALTNSRASVPILKTSEGVVIAGSSAIVAWSNTQNAKLLINDQTNALEKRLDDVLGVHIRRWFYSEALLDAPHIVRPVFAHGASWTDKLLLRLTWPKVVPRMIQRMDLGPNQELVSKKIVNRELTWLNRALSDERGYLAGDCLSNADLAAASLLAPLFLPPEHPLYAVFMLPERTLAAAKLLSGGRTAQWLLQIYKQHRNGQYR